MKIFSFFEKLFFKKPIIKENTFFVWEPCSKSHSEIVPGYAKYLADLGYNVCVVVEKKHIKDGLFSLFNNEKIYFSTINSRKFKKYLKKDDLSNVKGILITTIGKLCDNSNYNQIYDFFNNKIDRSKIFFVEHDVKTAIDNNIWNDKIITLRKIDYKNAVSTVVNPHYFGEIKTNPKNKITNFITIGAIRPKRNSADLIVDTVIELVNSGYTNFKITVVGKGNIKNLPKNIRPYFDIKGRLPFDKMYTEIKQADFILTSYIKDNPKHIRYRTTGTSGSFQLVFGFLKPCIITKDFAPINGFNEDNAIVYDEKNDYINALKRAIDMNNDDYKKMQNHLKDYEQNFYNESINNLKNLIIGKNNE